MAKRKIDNEELKAKLESAKERMVQKPREMSERLKALLKKEIEEYKQRDKTRAAEMISIFAAHNYYANGFTPVELRTTLEDLGPTYVKIGQIMSSRVDLLPESYCKELEKLRQNVKPLDPEVARAVIEDETGKKIDEIFSEFRDKPLGSASIGQAHYAVLNDGTKVVVKVQRPLIADMMRKDFVLLTKLAEAVNVVADSDDGQSVDLLSVLAELEKVTEEELDFRVEAENTKFFKENCIDDEEVQLIGCEAGGKGVDTPYNAAALTNGKIGIFHGMKSIFNQGDYGQIAPVYSISAGLDYPGVGPEHAYLRDCGRAQYVPVNDEEAVEAFEYLSRMEGIIPAIESSHAVAHAMKIAPEMDKDDIIIICLSGRGDKDVKSIADYRGVDLNE